MVERIPVIIGINSGTRDRVEGAIRSHRRSVIPRLSADTRGAVEGAIELSKRAREGESFDSTISRGLREEGIRIKAWGRKF